MLNKGAVKKSGPPSEPQMRVLVAAHQYNSTPNKGVPSFRDLAEMLDVSHGAVAQTVQRLRRDGFLVPNPEKENGKRASYRNVLLTPEGKTHVRAHLKKLLEASQESVSDTDRKPVASVTA